MNHARESQWPRFAVQLGVIGDFGENNSLLKSEHDSNALISSPKHTLILALIRARISNSMVHKSEAPTRDVSTSPFAAAAGLMLITQCRLPCCMRIKSNSSILNHTHHCFHNRMCVMKGLLCCAALVLFHFFSSQIQSYTEQHQWIISS